MIREKKFGRWLCPKCGGAYLAIYEDPRRRDKPLYNCQDCGALLDRIGLHFAAKGGLTKEEVQDYFEALTHEGEEVVENDQGGR